MTAFSGNMNISSNSTVMAKFPGDSESKKTQSYIPHFKTNILNKEQQQQQQKPPIAHCSIDVLGPAEVKQLFAAKWGENCLMHH